LPEWKARIENLVKNRKIIFVSFKYNGMKTQGEQALDTLERNERWDVI